MAMTDKIRFTFLYIEHYSMGKTWVYPETGVPYNMLRYIVSGKAEFCINDEPVIAEENQIVYIPNGCRMSCCTLQEPFEFYSIRFTTSTFYEGEDILAECFGIPRISKNEGEAEYFKEIYKWVKTESAVKKCFVRGYLDLLIASLAERSGRTRRIEKTAEVNQRQKRQKVLNFSGKQKIDARVQNVSDYIVLHPKEAYTPASMAKMAGLSKQRFSSLFKENMGKTPMEYVREIRLTTAARALLVSQANIYDIAYDVGYEDCNYFIREFKKAFGFTPNQYRKMEKE